MNNFFIYFYNVVLIMISLTVADTHPWVGVGILYLFHAHPE